MNAYYQVVGRGPWTIDHPDGNAVAYRPGQFFEAAASNAGVQRGLRIGRLRALEPREADALRAAHEAVLVKPKSGPPKVVQPDKASK